MEVFPGVSLEPGVRFGKPCLKGTRVDVATVVAALAAEDDMEAVRALTALRYAAHVAAHLPPAVEAS